MDILQSRIKDRRSDGHSENGSNIEKRYWACIENENELVSFPFSFFEHGFFPLVSAVSESKRER